MVDPQGVTEVSAVKRTLRLLGELEWGRYAIGLNPADSRMFPSSIVWRYREPSARMAEILRAAVAEMASRFEWRFDSSGKNWTLMPMKLAEVLEGPPQLPLVDALDELMSLDQNFCFRSNSELKSLLLAIEKNSEVLD
ncbi:hypothetical protein OG500_35185 [Kitasatospora sp. NBC_01250]|uniref:hypothetical protein n=1 Tax=Kitasatospora sp. NBC_01250 TaxID=2903571 RepID=UPI002E3784D5|nr:hypothetical protein [Kitasatospora sp. NBC_01250]